MSASFSSVAQDALILPREERLALARQLLESVDLEPEPVADVAWEAEIERRIEDLRSGKVKAIPAAELFARLRRIAPGR